MSSKRGRPRDIPFHPYAELFPLMHGRDFQELVDSIREAGHLVEDIVLHQAKVLDGRNRFRACRSAGVEPTFTVFGWPKNLPLPDFVVKACLAGRMLTAEQMGRLPLGLVDVDRSFPVDGIAGDALAFVVAKNLPRRHLDASQRSMAAAKYANMRQGARTDLRRGAEPVWPRGTGTIVPDPAGGVEAEKGADAPAEPGIPLPGAGRSGTEVPEPPANLPEVSQGEAAETWHVSERSLRTAKKVLEEGAPELVAAVEAGQASVAAAEKIAALPKAAQVELLKRVAARADDARSALKQAAKEVRRGEQEERHKKRRAKGEAIAAGNPGPLGRTFPIVVVDIPRRARSFDETTGSEKAPDNHYPTLDFEEQLAFPIDSYAAPECILFFASTAASLLDDLDVLAEWGCCAIRPRGPDGKLSRDETGALLPLPGRGRYGSHIVWRKHRLGKRRGLGRWVDDQHELWIIARRGPLMPAPLPGTQPPSCFDAPVAEHSAKPNEALRDFIDRCWPDQEKLELFARKAAPRPGWTFWGNQAELPARDDGALHISDRQIGAENEAEPPPFVDDDIPAFLRRTPGKAETAPAPRLTDPTAPAAEVDAEDFGPVERGIIFDEGSCPAGLDFDALHLFFDEWDVARRNPPRGRSRKKPRFPQVDGPDLVAAIVAGELVPVAHYPASGAYVIEHHLRPDRKDRKFRFVADGAALDADAPAARALAEAAE
jgi:N6-adenosine-specific RNA methylase IME4